MTQNSNISFLISYHNIVYMKGFLDVFLEIIVNIVEYVLCPNNLLHYSEK
jgi:hypothetical protein